MTSQTTLDDDEPPHLTSGLLSQLEQIAKNHGGLVPLHGRLFAQWLHYVFPRECPFPHKIGAVSSATPGEYGDQHVATKEEMKKHASNAESLDIPVSVGKEELQWMSQWSPDEELMVDYSSELSGSWSRFVLVFFGLILAACGIYGGSIGLNSGSSKSNAGMPRSSL